GGIARWSAKRGGRRGAREKWLARQRRGGNIGIPFGGSGCPAPRDAPPALGGGSEAGSMEPASHGGEGDECKGLDDVGGGQRAACCVQQRRRRVRVGRCGVRDRKSTRLNSSHVKISYAVFCLKKKRKSPVETERSKNTSRLK